MPSVSQSFKNVVTTGVSAAPGELDEAFATCFEGQWHSIRSGEVLNAANQACDSPNELSSSITKGHPRIQRIQIVAPTGEELDRLRQAVELDRELLAVRKQLLAVEKERCLFSASALGLSPRGEQPYNVHSYHVGDRSAALSEEHVRTCTAFDEAVLTMRRGYSLEAGAVVHSMAEDRCDAHGMPHEAVGINCHAASSSRTTPMGAAYFVPPFFADHTSMPAAAAPPDPGRPPNTHAGDPPFATPRAGLMTLPTVPSHHLDMPSPRPQVPFRSIDTADEPNQANNTAPLPPGPSATAFSNGSTTSASYSSAFQLRTHRTFNSEPAPRTRRVSSTSSHFPPVPSAGRGCTEASKLSRVFRTAIHCLPPGSAIIDHAHVLAAPAGQGAHAAAPSAEFGCRRSVADAVPSVEYAASGGHGSGPLQPLVPHAAHEPACLPPDVPIVNLADVEAAVRAYEIQSSCMDDMHDCSSEIKRGPPGSREEAGGQQCLELLRGAHLRPWSVTAESVFSRLRSLSINHTTGHDYCAALAPHLEAMAGLKSLDMSNTELCAAGAAALAPRLPGLRSLKRLNLSGNRLGSEGVRALAPALARLPSLRQLDIRDNGAAMHALHEVEAMLSGDVVLLC